MASWGILIKWPLTLGRFLISMDPHFLGSLSHVPNLNFLLNVLADETHQGH